MSQALYRKWRSQTFEEVIGQEHVTQTLRNALRDGRIAHAYLFSGPRGTGKTSTARILAKALNCTGPEDERPCNRCPTCVAINEGRMLDLIEIDAASNNSVDDIRDLREKVGFRPSEGRYKIYIIDEVHMLSSSAFNALLKTLEEPPPHTRFVLATTEPHKIPATVLSRCQRFDFRRIPVPEITAHLRHIVEVEGFQADDEALTAMARSAQGCMRDAVSLLDQMLSFGAERVTLEQVHQVLGAVSSESVAALVDALAAKDVTTGLTLIQQLVTQGASLHEFDQQVVEHLRGVMVLKMTGSPDLLPDLPGELVARMEEQASRMPLAVTLHAVKRFSEAAPALKGGYQPQLPLELAFIEAIEVATPRVVESAAPGVQAAPVAPATPAATPQTVQPATQPATALATGEPAPAPEAEGAPLDEAAIRKLHDQWKGFLAIIKQTCGFRVQAALNSVRDIAISERSVALAFGNNTFARDMIAQTDTLHQVGEVMARFLDRPVQIDCQMGMKAKVSKPIGVSNTQVLDEGPDPLIVFAVDNLGAEVAS
jgi:DNA polymerase-3 subunit gamma/tau